MENIFREEDISVNVGEIVEIAKAAGEAILVIYDQPSEDWDQKVKSDDSPLTAADLKSNAVICEKLSDMFPSIPIMSEETKQAPFEERSQWRYYFCIDPLDGTKEFIKRNGEFTVNIALMKKENGCARPVLGVVYTPVTKRAHFAVDKNGAFLEDAKGVRPIHALKYNPSDSGLIIVCSRSHLDERTQAIIDTYTEPQTTSMGSSLKFMLVAEGAAHVYPRLAPTMEWDTAASQIIVEEAGGTVIDHDTKEPLRYCKEDLKNPFFICYGDKE